MIIWIVITCLVFVVSMLLVRNERRKMKMLMKRLIQKIDLAVEGEKDMVSYDEEMESLVANKLNRYIEIVRGNVLKSEEEKEAVKTLISDMTHQTKTPLANILLHAQLAQEHENISPEVKNYLSQIHSQADKLDFLIDSLVKASYLEGGLVQIHVVKDDLAPLLEEIGEEMSSAAQKKQIKLEQGESTGTNAVCRYDYKWTREAIMNVLDNAVKYSQPGSVVSMDVQELEMFLRVDIKDNGNGITEDEFGKIFTRFYRSPDVVRIPGVGIGLYLTREIMLLQGGYVKVASQKGKGTVFSLYFARQ